MAEPSGRFSRKDDLTGLWSGEYWHAENGQPPAAFSAWLVQSGSQLAGTTLEIVDSRERAAILDGGVAGAEVTFTKTYDPKTPPLDHPIGYSGFSDAEMTRIDGSWIIRTRQGAQTGGFFMERVSRGAAADHRQLAETLDNRT